MIRECALRTAKRTYIDDLAAKVEEAASRKEGNVYKITKIYSMWRKQNISNIPIKDKTGTILTSEMTKRSD
jgi:hypothetical protein